MSDRDAAERTRIADLPVLTTRRACWLADCSPTTLQRRGPAPIGKRGKTYVYSTAAVLEWLSSGLSRPAQHDSKPSAPKAMRVATAATGGAMERLKRIARGGSR